MNGEVDRGGTQVDRYAVFGHPVEHSKSPHIHTMFAAQTQQQLSYCTQNVGLDDFAQALQAFFAKGGMGISVTVPFKQQAWQLVDDCSEQASNARAVNTIMQKTNGDLYGTNTDGMGLLADLHNNLQWSLKGARVLVLGAGGATRGVLQSLFQARPEELAVHNRTKENALVLQKDLLAVGPVQLYSRSELAEQHFDLIINATSASLHGKVPDIPSSIISANTKVYDMFYSAEPTVFMRWAKEHGASASADGLGMLVEQAAEAFQFWRGVSPDTKPVMDSVRASL